MNQYSVTLIELRKQYGSQHIPYSVLLETAEWGDRRKVIISRDGNKCTCCDKRPTLPRLDNGKWVHIDSWIELEKKTKLILDEHSNVEVLEYEEKKYCQASYDIPTILQVHHLYYIKGRLPWDYKDDAFQTLCSDCHQKAHDREEIKVYETVEGMMMEINCQPCSRCNGAGYFPQYRKVNNGRCFKCEGARYTNIEL